jgi:chemotaxis protein methyltransferase CheR
MFSNDDFELLIQEIYSRYQYDFRLYSKSSLRRRLEQALIKFQCHDVREIILKIQEEKEFFPKLLAYLTVNTTEMFRDPGYFKSMRENVFPYLKTFPSLKIWIAGCSTGEEVISFSILLQEAGIKRYIIYASDINPMNLERAKKAIYDTDAIRKASTSYHEAGGTGSLADYYQAAYDSVQFNQDLLSNVVFSDHSLATDAVFSEMHLISCRNVLIYFEKPLQERVFKLFNESLIRDGFLGLGSKETIQFSSIKDNYEVRDKENKIYQKVWLR